MQLPVAACSVGENREVLMWNLAMEQLTASRKTGWSFCLLQEPWRAYSFSSVLNPPRISPSADFSSLDNRDGSSALFRPWRREWWGLVILIEDTTETQLLEEELIHSERLASVGRLAAGVAHEIGNPITGIALSQNLKLMTENQEVLDTSVRFVDTAHFRILQTLMNFSRRSNHSNQTLWGNG